MPELRYTGTTHWTRTIVDEDGKFKKFEMVAPGETVTVEGDTAKRLLSGPRYNRLFVQAGGSEDPQSDEYVGSRQIGDGGMYVSEDPGREYGTTVPDGRVTFRTEKDNEEQFPIAGPADGPQSDNAELYDNDEIEIEADKARRKARERRSSGDSKPAGRGDSGPPTTPPRSDPPQRSQS